MESYKALYYPFIHFKDDSWVKTAALFWDRIGRIVPGGYETADSETVIALSSLIDSYSPNDVPYEFDEVFANFVNTYAAELHDQFGVHDIHSWQPVAPAQRPPTAGGPSGDDVRLGYVYYEKVGSDTYNALFDAGLIDIESRGKEWIGMHPDLTWVYMTAIASELSSSHGMRPLTDQTRDHAAVADVSMERLANSVFGNKVLAEGPAATEMESCLISVACKNVIPTNLAKLDPDRILEFREKYPKDRIAFQKNVEEFLSKRDWLKQINDQDALEERLREEFEKHWLLELDELREKLNDVGISTIYSSFNVKTALPTGIAGAAAAFAMPLNPIAVVTAGVAFSAIPILREKRAEARDVVAGSRVSYLYRMEQDLEPLSLMDGVRKSALSFALGV